MRKSEFFFFHTKAYAARYVTHHHLCEWLLGREAFVDKAGKPMELSPDPVTLDEIVAYLKRIRKPINRRNRRGGRQGYLTFVEQYVAWMDVFWVGFACF